jgi:periplasmic copper chaperone A
VAFRLSQGFAVIRAAQNLQSGAKMRQFIAFFTAAALLAACQQAPRAARIDTALVRLPAVPGNPGAGYFTLTGGPAADRLMSVSSPLAIRAEMHTMEMKGGTMAMTALDAGLDVPAAAAITFESGGKHVMLFDISPKVTAGATMPLELHFASGATLKADARVIAAGDDAPSAH